MQALVDVLKSRGKLGGWLLIVLGLGIFVAVGFGKLGQERLVEGTGAFGVGLSLIGIRGAQDVK